MRYLICADRADTHLTCWQTERHTQQHAGPYHDADKEKRATQCHCIVLTNCVSMQMYQYCAIDTH
jgi:hypothetical protein